MADKKISPPESGCTVRVIDADSPESPNGEALRIFQHHFSTDQSVRQDILNYFFLKIHPQLDRPQAH